MSSITKPLCIGDPWLDTYIEPGVRPIVKMLRDNGVNTYCSCEHDGYVQCELYDGDDLDRIHALLVAHKFEPFEMTAYWYSDAFRRRWLEIDFPNIRVPREATE